MTLCNNDFHCFVLLPLSAIATVVRSLSIDARWVLDFTDHVWAEVGLLRLNRIVTCSITYMYGYQCFLILIVSSVLLPTTTVIMIIIITATTTTTITTANITNITNIPDYSLESL